MSIQFGVDYYPEHWARERWEVDISYMAEIGIHCVRLAEFSWHKMEPEEGKYDFFWLEEIISLLAKAGIKVVLGTPTAAPPAWMVRKHPEILPLDKEGRVRGFGGRHHDCQSNEIYRNYIQKLVTKMAKQFADNVSVIGWQPDNELGNSHHELCMCNSCEKSFQKWLKKKYTTVEELNRAWGTAFWSQEVNSFKEVFVPKITVTGVNPAQMLDWRCFHSDLIVDFMKFQTDLIRKYCPNHFITHNYMGFASTVNYYDLGKELDFVSHDQYPGGFFAKKGQEDTFRMAAALDVVRSYKNASFWIMEQQSGITGWEIMGPAPKPGQLSSWTVQSIAHGADAIVFFRWRTCTVGTEQYWHGILPHNGQPRRHFYELKDTINKMTPIMKELKGSMPDNKVGILFSFRQSYAFEFQPHHPEFSYLEQLMMYYKTCYDLKVGIDFVTEESDFSDLKVLIAPLQYLMNKELEDKYIDYVRQGGQLVLTMRTGVKDEHNNCMADRALPGRLGELAGLEVIDYDCLRSENVDISYGGEVFQGKYWADLIEIKEGTVIEANYTSNFYKNTPAITSKSFEQGKCYYIGTEPEEKLIRVLLEKIFEQNNIKKLGTSVEEVEITMRQNKAGKWLFVINHSENENSYEIQDKTKYEMILGELEGFLKPYEYHIYYVSANIAL